jgi:hypothetical protein
MNTNIPQRPGRNLALLILLLLLFILSPFVVTLRYGILLLNIVGAAVLLSGMFSGHKETGPVVDYIARVMRMRHFSFVTITTVGFGDIVPRSQAVRTFATLEAVVGQIHLAVLSVRLVGLHVVHGTSPRSRDD